VSERHLCGVHGNRQWFASVKGVLIEQVDNISAGWLPAGVAKDDLKRRISGARTLAEARDTFRPR
jgi:hypothetical protein